MGGVVSGAVEPAYTHHRVAGLKHLAEQDTAFLLGKGFSERIQDTSVSGVQGVWALRGQSSTVDLLTPHMPTA